MNFICKILVMIALLTYIVFNVSVVWALVYALIYAYNPSLVSYMAH